MSLRQLQKKLREDIVRRNGHQVETGVPPNHTQCPGCGKVYRFSKPERHGAAWEREQHISGYCSDACWPLADE